MKFSKMIIAMLCVAFCVPSCFAVAEEVYSEPIFAPYEQTTMTDSQAEIVPMDAEVTAFGIEPYADPVVISYILSVTNSGQVAFSLTLKNKASSISITSVTLSTNGGSAVSLSKPTTKATNTNYFEAFKTYTFSTGNTYTLTCTWNIDGYSYTRSTTFSR